ncbi:MAG TPA: homoserine dehydrogenase, partial [Longimicrobiales bacterium]|nr:homoserine dehydrogenase [Longimicrobiales bacterium]
MRVALAGCGVVGSELTRIIGRQAADCEVVRVLVRDTGKERSVPVARNLFTDDVDDFLSCEADVVVEAIGGFDPSHQIARATLARGARFVTANKALIAQSGDELLALARTTGGRIDFEAAVGGGIPVIRSLRNSLRNTRVQSIAGILNGTTNYILTRIEQGETFDEALSQAQENGFAEADSSRDLNGTDSADKLRILAWIAFGVRPAELHVEVRGILPNPEQLVSEAKHQGGCLRLIAQCERTADGVRASVAPTIVPLDSAFARNVDEQNLISIDLG